MTDRYTLEHKRGVVYIYAWGTYPQGSVLEGQDKKSFVDTFHTESDARLVYPDAELSNGGDIFNSVGPQPADWYAGDGGYYACGEHWDEQD